MQLKSGITIVLCIFIFASAIGFASATEANRGSVWSTTDGNPNNWETDFLVGQSIYINWLAKPVGSTVDISVTFEDDSGVPLANGETGLLLVQIESGTIYFVPMKPGDYTIHMNGAEDVQIAVATVFVVPESTLGTLMAALASLAAFGTIGIVKRKRPKNVWIQ
jgi:hypothetical protein